MELPPDYASDGTNPGPAREVQMKTVHRKGRAGRPAEFANNNADARMMAEVEWKPGRLPMTLPAPPLSAGY